MNCGVLDLAGQEPVYVHDLGESKNLDRFGVTIADALNPQAKINRIVIAVDIGPDGEPYVLTFGNGIKKVGPNGGLIDFIPNISDRLSNAMDFAINTEGKFFVATNESNRRFIRVYSPEGVYLPNETLGDGSYGTGANKFKGPVGLTFDKNDNLYVADHYIGDANPPPPKPSSIKIYRKDAAGNYKNNLIREFDSVNGILLNFPYRIAVNSRGQIYISELGQDNKAKVRIINLDDNFNPTGVVNGPAANLGAPGSIIIDKFDNIFVADFGNEIDLPRLLAATGDIDEFYKVFEIIKTGIRNDVFKINVYNPDNSFRSLISSQIDFPIDFAISSCGTLYVNNAVFDGTIKTFFGQKIPDITMDFDLEVYQRSSGYDTEAPALVVCPSDQEGNLTNGAFVLDDYRALAEFKDNCDNDLNIVQNPPSNTTVTETTEVTITAYDDAGNQSEVCRFRVILSEKDDTVDPTFENCSSSNLSFLTDADECGTVVNYNVPIATDNSGNVSTEKISGPAPGDFVGMGTVTVLYRAIDGAGNTAECRFTITVIDDKAPNVSCPGDISETVASGETGKIVTFLTPEISDNCSGASMRQTSGPASGEVFSVGETTVAFEVTDASGNKNTCSFKVVITEEADTEPPVFDCLENITVSNTSGKCGAEVTFSAPNATDNSGVPNIVQSKGPTSGSFFPIGPTTVTFTATDAAGNSTQCSFDVIVKDEEAPVFTSCPGDFSETVASGETGKIITFLTPEYSDNCSGASITRTSGFASGEKFPVGETIVTFVVKDAAGNEDTCSFKVVITEEADTEDPVFTCPEDMIVFNSTGKCGAEVTFSAPNATDNSGEPKVVQTDGPASGSFFPVGSTTVIFEATDAAGNSAKCSFDVIVKDEEAPVFISCPGDISETVASGETGKIITFLTPEFGDNCSGATIRQTGGPTSGETFPVGSTTVLFEVKDAAGNIDTCSFEVVVTKEADTELPVFDCPGDMTFYANAGECGTEVTFSTPSVTDNGGSPTVVQTDGPTSGSLLEAGAYILVFRATDAAGNVKTCSIDISVIDDQKPQIACPGDILEIVPSGQDEKIIYFETPEFSDNCSGATIRQTEGPASGENFPLGTTNVAFEAEDPAGNIQKCSFEVTVSTEADTESPVFDCPGDMTFYANAGECGTEVTFSTPSATDNGGSPTVVQTDGPTSGSFLKAGTYIVVFRATDAAGNVKTCSIDISVIDDQKPQIACPGDILEIVPGGQDGKIIYFDPPEFSDNCSGATIRQTEGPASGETFSLGTTNVAFEAEDPAGNIQKCSFEVTVSKEADTEPPVFDCPEALVFFADEDQCGTKVTFSDPVVTDPSGILQLVQTDGPASGSFVEVGTTAVIFMATDEAGNTSYCNFYLVVRDEIPPAIECPGELSVAANASGIFTVPNLNNLVFDNCEVASVTQDPPAGTVISSDTEVVLRAADASENTIECKVQLKLTQEEILQITTCAMPRTEFLNLGCSFTLPDYTSEVVTNLQADLKQYPVSGTEITEATTIKIVAERDGKMVECSFLVSVEDNTHPEQVCLADKTAVFNSELGYELPDYRDEVMATDNCDFTINQDPPPGTVLFQSRSIFITVIDSAGNQSMCGFSLDLTPEEEPQINCKDTTLALDQEGKAVLNAADVFNGDINDAEIEKINLSKNEFTCTDLGENAVEVTVEFKNGTSATCSARVTIVDTQEPILECVAGATIRLNAFGKATVSAESLTLSLSDNCGLETVSLDKSAFSEADLGENLVTVTAVDSSGNAAECQTIVTVLPYEEGGSGIIICPEDATIPLNENGEVRLSISFQGDADVDFELSKSFFTCHDIGVHTITVKYTGDYEGTCTSEITIVDATAPRTSCVGEFDLFLDQNGRANLSAEDINLNSSDNCGIAGMSISKTEFSTADIGAQEVVLTVRDASGNESTCSTTVNVRAFESTDPEIACVSSIDLVLNSSGEATINPRELFTGGSGSGEYTISKEKFNCTDIGEQEITFTYKTPTEEGSCTILVRVNDPDANCETIPVEPPESDSFVILYPNPSRGLFKIKTSSEIVLERAEIFDMRGRFLARKLLTVDPNAQGVYTIDIRGYRAGVYNIKLFSADQEFLKRAIITPE